MSEYSRIIIENYCMEHFGTKKGDFLWEMVNNSYDMSYLPTDEELIYLEQLIKREKDEKLKEALMDLDDFMTCNY